MYPCLVLECLHPYYGIYNAITSGNSQSHLDPNNISMHVYIMQIPYFTYICTHTQCYTLGISIHVSLEIFMRKGEIQRLLCMLSKRLGYRKRYLAYHQRNAKISGILPIDRVLLQCWLCLSMIYMYNVGMCYSKSALQFMHSIPRHTKIILMMVFFMLFLSDDVSVLAVEALCLVFWLGSWWLIFCFCLFLFIWRINADTVFRWLLII